MRNIVLVDRTRRHHPEPGALEAIADALTVQVKRDFAPRWGLAPVTVTVGGRGEKLYFFDRAHDDDYGFHQVAASGRAFAHVAVEPSLAHSGWLTGNDAVSASASHEVLEMLADPAANAYAFDAFGEMWMREACDAVQAYTYDIRAGGRNVKVSDFVLPSFFNHWAPKPYDYLRKLRKPFTIAPGGYAMRGKAGTDHKVEGPALKPEFRGVEPLRRAEKLHPLGRPWWRLEMQPRV
jgi:hypothetical protein